MYIGIKNGVTNKFHYIVLVLCRIFWWPLCFHRLQFTATRAVKLLLLNKQISSARVKINNGRSSGSVQL